MSAISERMAASERDRASAATAVTDADILTAMDPNGATLKLGAIVAELKARTGYSEYALFGNVQNKLRRMRKAGRVELTKGPGSGWRIVKRVDDSCVNYTDAVVFVRDLRDELERDLTRLQWTFSRDEIKLILAAIDYVTDGD